MILGVDIIKEMVEGLCERELNNPEGAGLDLRLGEVYELVIEYGHEAFLGVEERQTPDVKLLAKYDSEKREKFIFKPGGYWLVKTIEKVKTPKNVQISLTQRRTLFQCGLALLTAKCAPGYEGFLTFGLKNLGSIDVPIELGARIVHATFDEVKGRTEMYRGQWQSGVRTSTNGRETQI